MPRSHSEKTAERVRAAVGDTLPVDVEAIAVHYGIAVRRQPLEENVSGVLVINGEIAVICVNESHHPNRQRFTIAHELGHYLLHRERTRVFVDAHPVFYRDETSSDGNRGEEIEANAFAAELLMPEAVLMAQVGDQPLNAFDDVSVRHLATQFGVSPQALIIRLTRLNLITE